MNILLIVIIAIIVIIGLLIVKYYNDLVNGRNRVENAWSQIDVQLQRRNDLIPNIVETVKGYASHEKETFNQVTQARASMANATTVQEVAEANNNITEALKSLFAISEAYPDLKANQNFIELQQELSDTEDKISYARQFYNDTVLKYNNLCQQFPSSLVASIFHFDKSEFFEAQEGTRAAPNVKF
ncbi:MAG TPA: LemA family protein [Methanosphaera sp.]|jgi:LemA protein|nr:LemA family protein [Methanosphaera sp.]